MTKTAAEEFDIEKALEIISNFVGDELPPAELYALDPFRVLVSCVISLRTKDKTTEKASKRVFDKINSVGDLAQIDENELARLIYPAGFYNAKAKNLKLLAKKLLEENGGQVYDDIDKLLALPGVGRKTANLVVTVGFGKDGICVDTHVHRIVNRFGYVKTKTPDDTEAALRQKLPKHWRIPINRILVLYGQKVCRPVGPKCGECALASFCPKVGVVLKEDKIKSAGKRGQ